MYIFGCEDTTTIIMDSLTLEKIRVLLCINKDFYNIKNNGYYSIRVIQEFFKKYKKIKCHENKYSCKKITLSQLLKNSEKYIGKTIQFIMPLEKIAYKPCHHTLWHCKFGGSSIPPNLINVFNDKQGIIAKHLGHINHNIYPKSSSDIPITKLDNEDSFTFFGKTHKIYEYSVRIID